MKEFEIKADCCKDCLLDPCCSKTCKKWQEAIFKESEDFPAFSSRSFYIMDIKYDPETGEVIQENEETGTWLLKE